MSNWDKFKDQKEDKPLPSYEIGGSLQCQVCDEIVEVGQYFYTDNVLKWKCSQDHVSFAENIHL